VSIQYGTIVNTRALLLDPVIFAAQFTEEDFRMGETVQAKARYLKRFGVRPQEQLTPERLAEHMCALCINGKHCSDPDCRCICGKLLVMYTQSGRQRRFKTHSKLA
jgi:hypothetical protein